VEQHVAKASSKNTKFKVGDEIIRIGRPFELREVIKQLPFIEGGEYQYRIGPLRMRRDDGTIIKASASGGQRDVRENELMRLDEVLDELLDFAKAKRGTATKNALLAAVCCARIDYDRLTKKLPPAHIVENLEKSIETTANLLAELATEHGILDNVLCKSGDGIVDVSPLPEEIPELIPFGKQTLKKFQFEPHFKGTAIIRIRKLLRFLNGAIKNMPRKKRYGQTKEYKTAIVERAVQFFCQHSDKRPSTDPDNPLHGFVELFYERVLGTEPERVGGTKPRSLDYHVRGALSALRGLEINRSKS
jgi:hypothetical protein